MAVFTEDWFTNNIPLWKKQLGRLRGKPLSFLEVGTFEGRSALWMLENVLTHPDSLLYIVDDWSDAGDRNSDPYATFLRNIAQHRKKVKILRGCSREMLRGIRRERFDFAYIDASKHSRNVLEEAVLIFPLLKPNALLIFDDYTHNKEHSHDCPRHGVDAFLNVYANHIRVLHLGWQAVIRKRARPLPDRPCYSEYFEEPRETPTIYRRLDRASRRKGLTLSKCVGGRSSTTMLRNP